MVLPSDASVLSHVFWKYFRKFLNQQAFKFLRRKNTRSACFSGDPSPELKPTAAEPRARGSPCPRGAVGSAPGGAPPTQQGAAETAVRPAAPAQQSRPRGGGPLKRRFFPPASNDKEPAARVEGASAHGTGILT